MTRKLFCFAVVLLALTALVPSAQANDTWQEYIDNAHSIGNSSVTISWTFNASEVNLYNAGAQSCYANFKAGAATTAHRILRAGGYISMQYAGDDRNAGGGFTSVKVICPSTSTVDTQAVSFAR